MKRIGLVAVICLAFGLSECKKSGSEGLPELCLISTVKTASGTTTYIYSNDLLVSSTDGKNLTTYFYNSGGKLDTSYYLNDVTSYLYNIDEVIEIDEKDTRNFYTYNSTGQLVKAEFYSKTDTDSDFELEIYTTYEYPNTTTDDYTTTKNFDPTDDALVSTTTYTYDNKKNYKTGTPKLPGFTTNNQTQSIYTPTGGDQQVVDYSYTYTANDFPLTMTITYTTTGTASSTVTFTYTNCK